MGQFWYPFMLDSNLFFLIRPSVSFLIEKILKPHLFHDVFRELVASTLLSWEMFEFECLFLSFTHYSKLRFQMQILSLSFYLPQFLLSELPTALDNSLLSLVVGVSLLPETSSVWLSLSRPSWVFFAFPFCIIWHLLELLRSVKYLFHLLPFPPHLPLN